MTSKFTGAGRFRVETPLPCFARFVTGSAFNTTDSPSVDFMMESGDVIYIVRMKGKDMVRAAPYDRKTEVTFITELGIVRTVLWWTSFRDGALGCIEKVEA